MEVQDRVVAKTAFDQARGEDTPVASTTDRQPPFRRDRKFPEIAAADVEHERVVRNRPEPVGNARGVVLRRVATEPELRQDLVRPRCRAVDRERRCAVRGRPAAGDAFDRLDAACDVGAKLISRLVVDAFVGMAVRRGVMAARNIQKQ